MDIRKAVEMGISKLAELAFDNDSVPGLDTYIKPTTHIQDCYVCHTLIKKGEMLVKEVSGCTRYGYPEYMYSHLDCYLAMVFASISKIEELEK